MKVVQGRVPRRRFADEIQIVLAERCESGVKERAVLSARTWRVLCARDAGAVARTTSATARRARTSRSGSKKEKKRPDKTRPSRLG
jgi:hypothetical protein